jgi:hypothetical protein
VAIATFTQQQILNGEVRFVHDGSNLAPTFSIQVTDGTAPVGPFAANIVFNLSNFTPPSPPGGGGGGGGSTTVTSSAPPPAPGPASDPGPTFQSFLRPPTGAQEGGEDVEEPRPAPSLSAEARAVAALAQTLPIRTQAEVLETTPTRTEIEVEPIRAEMQVLPTSHQFAQDDEEKRRIEVIMGTVRITGLALSVGAVWWAARAAGLIASLLASAPAWRHMDPLPVLGRDEEDEQDREDADDEDQDRRDEEHRASWILEGGSKVAGR